MTANNNLCKKLDNVTLKQWLRDVGPVRRREILQKLKLELEGLGVPKLRHGLRHGLIHLFSECSVIVERLPSNAAFRFHPYPEGTTSKVEKPIICNKYDIKKNSSCDKMDVFSKKVSSMKDPQNLSESPKNCKNITKPLSQENLDPKDFFKTPYLPSTKICSASSQKKKACPLSHKKSLEPNFRESAMSKKTKVSFSDDSSAKNSPVLKNTSENKLCSLEKTPQEPSEDTEDSESEKNSKRLLDNRKSLSNSKSSSVRRHSADIFISTSNTREKVRTDRSHSADENTTKKSCSEKENSKLQNLETKTTSSDSRVLDPATELLQQEKRKCSYNEEESRRKSREVDLKKKKKKKRSLKSVFHELFGEDEERGQEIQKNLDSTNILSDKRRKVDSRDSCDSGAYCSETSPISVTNSKDAEPSEMFSPDSTEIESRKNLESPSEAKEIVDKREKQKETNNEDVLPDSSTCISDDDLLKDQDLNSKSDSNGPFDDTLFKAGIVRDIEKDSYIFSSDDIHLLLNILGNTANSIEDPKETGEETDVTVLEKSTISIPDQTEPNLEEPVDNPIEPLIFVPRLRVKDPSELGCPKSPTPSLGLVNAHLPNQIPSWTRPVVASPVISPSPPNPTVSDQRSDHFSTNQVVNVALAAAQRLISLINPLTIPEEAPQLSHYYNMLITILGNISNDTLILRNSYLNHPYGLLSTDLFGYNLAMNRKLRSLAKFLNVAFEENTMQFILNNYHALTTLPILNKDELHFIMSLQYSDLDQNDQNQVNQAPVNANQVSTVPQTQPPDLGIQQQQQKKSKTGTKKAKGFTNEQYIILKTQINAYNILATRLNQMLRSNSILEQTLNSNLNQQKVESPRIVQQSNDYMNQQQTELSRILQQSNSMNQKSRVEGTATGQNTLLFRMRNTSTDTNNTGLVITPVTISASSNSAISAKSVTRNSALTSFPSELSIRAVATAVPTPLISTRSVAKIPSPLAQTCTVTAISTLATNVSSTPSVIVSSPILSSAISGKLSSVPLHRYPLITLNQPVSTPKNLPRLNSPISVTSSAPSQVFSSPIIAVTIFSPIVSAPIMSAPVVSAPIMSAQIATPGQKQPLISNKTRVITTNPAHNFRSNFSSLQRIDSPVKSQSQLQATQVPQLSASQVTTGIPQTPSFNLADPGNIISIEDPATDSTRDFESAEMEFRSMPSLSPDPSPSLQRVPTPKSSENTQQANQDEEDDLLCFRCKEKSTCVCSRCRVATYCSKTCQEKHWEEVHHETCQTETKD